MSWPEFFALCLGVGFAFSLLTAFSGALHIPHLHLHLHGPHGKGIGSGALNPGTLAAFLMWFGAAGYLLEKFADWKLLPILLVSSLCGLAGGAIVFWFLAKVLIGSEQPLDPSDYDMTGALGQISSGVRREGTGEMIFTQQGRRRGVSVRSENGEPLERGTEVVVTRYENGIAWVRSWDEMQKL